jgi:hypothetical protein
MKQPNKTAKIPSMSCVRFMPRISPAGHFPTFVQKVFVVRLFNWVRCASLPSSSMQRDGQTKPRVDQRMGWPSDPHRLRIVTAARAAVRECSTICKISRRLLHSVFPVLFELQINPRVQPFAESYR